MLIIHIVNMDDVDVSFSSKCVLPNTQFSEFTFYEFAVGSHGPAEWQVTGRTDVYLQWGARTDQEAERLRHKRDLSE